MRENKVSLCPILVIIFVLFQYVSPYIFEKNEVKSMEIVLGSTWTCPTNQSEIFFWNNGCQKR